MNWIKIEISTPTKPEVMALAGILNIEPNHAFGLVAKWFIYCDANVTDGYIPKLKPRDIDHIVGHENFGKAMIEVDWLRADDAGVLIVNYNRHMSKSAKQRALAAERKKKSRDAKAPKGR